MKTQAEFLRQTFLSIPLSDLRLQPHRVECVQLRSAANPVTDILSPPVKALAPLTSLPLVNILTRDFLSVRL